MRVAIDSDLPEIVAIYNSTVESRLSTADTEEVSIESKMQWFKAHTPDKRPILVHEDDNTVAAWVSFEKFYGRPAYGKTAEISIYIHSKYRGLGLGKKLLQEAIDMTPSLEIKTLVAYIFSHNAPSIRLFKSFGFKEWGRLPDIAEMDGKEYSLSILGKRLIT
ncbi:GNAT family N-acetyltransferase [Desulfovibrio gilichinskyi]|uniref:Phosphinothricin acetyltransferase n=1 Tax=Desulfovibrio gilichinskyi TaxID=1519643 RepID=A0A1X7E3P3_9BACT|nr:GNAT family N-acetyltransferase [Desulfovibrio gilichinskyi]SMF26338.1 phosphinothricin acetyltransferase [Desulfovibrio gilichinskyi]